MATKKRPEMPEDMFDDGGAISKLTGGSSGPARTENRLTTQTEVKESDVSGVVEKKQATSISTRKVKPTSFYVPSEQLGHLDELVFYHNRRTEQRINRNDVIRHLIAKARLEDLEDLVEEKQE